MERIKLVLKIADRFSQTPGPRYPQEGKHSGAEFRTHMLYPLYRLISGMDYILVVDLDGTSGYGTAFLEEVFGGLIRVNKVPLAHLRAHLQIVSEEEPDLLPEINQYIAEAALLEGVTVW